MTAAARISPAHVLEQASVIVFGRDGNKARASWFPGEQSSAAERAADMMGMNALKISNDDVRQLATKMPKGRLFDSGKAFVPFVQAAVCEQLVTHLAGPEKIRPRVVASAEDDNGGETGGFKPGNVSPKHFPKDWSDLKVGSLVLATEGDGEGWYESVVVAVKDRQLTLRWRDYPAEPNFTRPPERLALLWAPTTLAATN